LSDRPHDLPPSPDDFTLYPPKHLTNFYRLHLGKGEDTGLHKSDESDLGTSHGHHPPVTSSHRLAFFLDFTWPALRTQATGRHQLSIHTELDCCHRLGIYLLTLHLPGEQQYRGSEAGGGYACRITAISLTSASLDPIFSSLSSPWRFDQSPCHFSMFVLCPETNI